MNEDICPCVNDESCQLPTVPKLPKVKVGSVIIFKRNDNVRVGKVISSGPKYIGISVFGMKSNTKIPLSDITGVTEVFLTKDIKLE